MQRLVSCITLRPTEASFSVEAVGSVSSLWSCWTSLQNSNSLYFDSLSVFSSRCGKTLDSWTISALFTASCLNRLEGITATLYCPGPCFPSERSWRVHWLEATTPFSPSHALSHTSDLKDYRAADSLTSLITGYIRCCDSTEIKVLRVTALEGHCLVISKRRRRQ